MPAPPHQQRATTLVIALVVIALASTACGSDRRNEATVEQTTSVPATVAPPGANLEAPAVKVEEVVRLNKPVAMATRSGSNDVFIAEQAGTIRRISADPASGWARDERPFLDITSRVRAEGERGLLGIVFSLDGQVLYTHYTNTTGDTVLDAWKVGTNGIDTNSRRTIFTTPQPYANHNGGQIAFGPDGYLYIGLGDGGGSGDPNKNAQNTSTVLGAILRIDPDGVSRPNGDASTTTTTASEPGPGRSYGIPPDNPFRDGGAPEIWAFGLRNPWRFSFDRVTGDLWVGDVGESSLEEVDLLVRANNRPAGRGVNLGWPLFEGSQVRDGGTAAVAPVPPIFEYTHDAGGCSIIGGYVYRGAAIPDLVGSYLYGDFCQPAVRALRAVDGVVSAEGPLGVSVPSLSAFGQDQNGELWLLSLSGPVYRLVPA